MATLNEKIWLNIRARYEAGEKARDLASEYKIKVNTIYQRAKRQGWKKRGALKDEAIEKAKAEVAEKLKDSFVDRVEQANVDHTKYYTLPLKIAIQYMQALDKEIAEDMAAGRQVRLGNNPYLLAQLMATMSQSITGIRTVNKYDSVSPDTGDPSLEKLYESFDEIRKKRGIDDSPPKVSETDDEIDVPEMEVPDGI